MFYFIASQVKNFQFWKLHVGIKETKIIYYNKLLILPKQGKDRLQHEAFSNVSSYFQKRKNYTATTHTISKFPLRG